MNYPNTDCFVVNDGNNSALPWLAAMNGGCGNGMWNNPIWALVFLAFLGRNNGIFGGDNNSQLSQIQDTLNTNNGNQLLMNAISGNATSIKELASAINCNHNAVSAAINGVQSAICGVGNQVGMTREGIINAVQAGDTSIIAALKDCCCQTQQNIIKMGYENQINNLQQSQLIQNGFAQVGYASAEQTCAVKQTINDQTIAILNKLDAQESARKDREISALTAQLATVNARAERAAELAPIMAAIKDIQCKQPSTATVTYPNLVGIPAYQLYGAGVYGFNNGQWS